MCVEAHKLLYLCFYQEIGEFQQAIYSIHQLLDLREKEIDIRALQILTEVVLKDISDRYGEQGWLEFVISNTQLSVGSKLQKQLVELFGRATSKVSKYK